MYRYTGVNKCSDRAETHLLKVMYRRAQNEKYLSEVNRRTRLQAAKTLFVPFPVNEAFKKSPIYKGSTLWNSLSPETRNVPTFKAFKTCMKKIDREKPLILIFKHYVEIVCNSEEPFFCFVKINDKII